jgi:hypothetical protein
MSEISAFSFHHSTHLVLSALNEVMFLPLNFVIDLPVHYVQCHLTCVLLCLKMIKTVTTMYKEKRIYRGGYQTILQG